MDTSYCEFSFNTTEGYPHSEIISHVNAANAAGLSCLVYMYVAVKYQDTHLSILAKMQLKLTRKTAL